MLARFEAYARIDADLLKLLPPLSTCSSEPSGECTKDNLTCTQGSDDEQG